MMFVSAANIMIVHSEKEGKALQLSYAARMEFVSLTQQVAHGPCRPDTLPQLGVLDIVGRDRREAWQRLGDMSRPDSMVRYIEMLDAACPIFRPFAEAHRRDLEAQERRREEERAAEEQRRQADERERLQRELELSRQAETK
ncbi:Golgi resident protein GCP60 [Amphibalanus amphitrite]|uniref:Golgi resident protein GCP60 n=1 Tax=Amphibalanus amphitrite TaxID=1232801 RepID=A0A6A4VX96_AMPAM|nr:Golgi resident protein GCP60 [Amphibalanus amphitrite]